MQQQGIENKRLRNRLRYQKNSVELDSIKQLVADGGVLNDEQRVWLEVLRSARERRRLRRRLRNQKNSVELDSIKQLVADGGVLNDEQRAKLEKQQSDKKRTSEYVRLRKQKIRVELDSIKQLVADGGELDDVQRAKLEKQQSDKKRTSEYDRSRREAKRQKKEEDARVELGTHPVIELLLANSGDKKCSSKLIQLISKGISNGTVKNVLTSYFVPEQKLKLSNKFLKLLMAASN
jgi:hypothetical protein